VARREKGHREGETKRTRHPRMLGTRGVAVVAVLKTSCDDGQRGRGMPRPYLPTQVKFTPAPPGAAAGETAKRALPWPIVTVRPATMPMAAPKATSLK